MKKLSLLLCFSFFTASISHANVSLSETCQLAVDQYSISLIAQLRTATNIQEYNAILNERTPISECGQTQEMISVIGPQIGPRPAINTAIDHYMLKKGYAVEIVGIRSNLQSQNR